MFVNVKNMGSNRLPGSSGVATPGVAVHFISRIFYPGDSISHPGGYTDLSVKYPGSGYFIPGSHLASPR